MPITRMISVRMMTVYAISLEKSILKRIVKKMHSLQTLNNGNNDNDSNPSTSADEVSVHTDHGLNSTFAIDRNY